MNTEYEYVYVYVYVYEYKYEYTHMVSIPIVSVRDTSIGASLNNCSSYIEHLLSHTAVTSILFMT